jgi:two-component system, OmpR family, sensor histidine kinase CiaH
MFQNARIKLTAWYLLIIMLVSILFSIVIYSGINRELGRFERSHVIIFRDEKLAPLGPPPPIDITKIDTQALSAARTRLTLTLIFINVGIFWIAGLAGYFLAGRTLRPIKEMVDDQNRFITDASHELRTPLTSLKTSIEVNLRNKNMTLAQAKELVRSNLEDVEYLQTLSDGLIRLAYYQKPDKGMIFEKVSIKNILNDAINRVEAIAKENKIKINLKAENLKIEGDKKNLIELFVIILDNAIKYSTQNSPINISVNMINDRAVVAISDKGIGIDKKDLPYIFDRFYRAEKSRSKKDALGYGLGLSIAKKIVEAHSGSISVESEKGKGTTFTVTL